MLLCTHVCIYSPWYIATHIPSPFPKDGHQGDFNFLNNYSTIILCMLPLCMYVTLVISKLWTASKEEPCFSSPVIMLLTVGIFVDFLLQPVHAIYCKVLKIKVKLIIITRVKSCQRSLPELSWILVFPLTSSVTLGKKHLLALGISLHLQRWIIPTMLVCYYDE